MTRLALRSLRHRPGTAVATLVALTAGVAILLAMGSLVESGLRFSAAPVRYAAADAVVARPDLTVTGTDLDGTPTTSTVGLPEGGTVPLSLADRLRSVPGVTAVVPDVTIPVVAGGVPLLGHGFGGVAVLRGAAPSADDEVAVSPLFAGSPGDTVELSAGGVTRRYRVSGIVDGPGVYFTTAHALALNPRPGQADALLVSGALDTAGDFQVYRGAERGRAEHPAGARAAALLVEIGAAFGGYVVLLVGFVVAATVGLAVRQRRRELTLLRSVAATRGQVRRLVLAEVLALGLVAVALGLPLGWLAGRWVRAGLLDRGVVPADFPFREGLLAAPAVAAVVLLVAAVAALLGTWRAVRLPAGAPPRPRRRLRFGAGVTALAGGATLVVVTAVTGGTTALASATGLLYLLVLAVALLAPWINATAARLLARPLRLVFGAGGRLAAANLRANARGTVTVLTALVLAVGLGGSVWFLQDNLSRETVAQHRAGTVATVAVTAPGGLPPSAAAELRRLPGVAAATGVHRTAVVVRVFDGAESLPAQAVDPEDLPSTQDLRVRRGSLADLDATSLAVSSMQASSHGWDVGDRVSLWLGDGTPAVLRVAAVYDRGLAFGDVTLARATVTGHTAAVTDDHVLLRSAPGTDLAAALSGWPAAHPGAGVPPALAGWLAAHPGATLTPPAALTASLATDLALSAWLNRLLIAVLVTFAALAAANTMVVAALSRARELALLRLAGATKAQTRRMVHAEQTALLGTALLLGGAIAAVTLTSVVHTATGRLVPYVPWPAYAAILAAAAALALGTTILPVTHLLRKRPIQALAAKD
ncbi:FtsX-like permease family protein [Dactylosporangium sp. AC04546]|uniref:ABC transporter permease n=1 Tax=Dactylosporangium sp. AC04546 TaxID=2862460 RepID=UPI001EDF696A|nr:FtsX-like permease family protein [Dactylosporangium sp. AC04546]WVK89600.1 FtsX-like permease family protein [Dactylosporangium sp. AC04546]